VEAAPDMPQDMIDGINKQLAITDAPKQRAKLFCYRARNHYKAGDQKKAKDDYFKALNTSYEGWILHELGHFMYQTGEFEKAYNIADRVIADFPQFNEEAHKLKKQARQKWEEDYLKNNPPNITLDSAPDPYRQTRHDVIRQTQPKTYKNSGNASTDNTQKGSHASSNAGNSGGSLIRGFGTGSEFRKNYKKSQQNQ
jgi:tetratricopeptide (TPR) repeat protein